MTGRSMPSGGELRPFLRVGDERSHIGGGLVLGGVLGFLTAVAETLALKIVMIGIASLFGAAIAVALSRGRK